MPRNCSKARTRATDKKKIALVIAELERARDCMTESVKSESPLSVRWSSGFAKADSYRHAIAVINHYLK